MSQRGFGLIEFAIAAVLVSSLRPRTVLRTKFNCCESSAAKRQISL